MADRLTQLQVCLDQLATQMYASLMYTYTRSSYASIPGQPDQNPFAQNEPTSASQPNAATQNSGSTGAAGAGNQSQAVATQNTEGDAENFKGPVNEGPPPDTPQIFTATLHELARDLIVKEQQIEYLISVLPGIGTSEAAQNERLRKLEEELRAVESERKEAVKEKEVLLEKVDGVLGRVRRP